MCTKHLEISDLRVSFKGYGGEKQVLDLQRLEVDRGEAVGLVGESGSGKSVLALTLLRLLRTPPAIIEFGKLEYDGRAIGLLPEREVRAMRGREIAMIFQDPMSSLNPVFTVGSQMGNVIHRIHGEGKKAARQRALDFVSLVGLPDPDNMLDKYPHQLSGGQRQRVIIALALCCDAKFIIADEPTRNLDVTVQAGILKTIANLRSELGVSLLFIANNLGLVSAMCDRVSILLDGRVVESGTVSEVVGSPQHPYTRMLLRAIPTTEEQRANAPAMAPVERSPSGLPREAEETAGGCTYYDRCSRHEHACLNGAGRDLVSVGGTHQVACLVSQGLGVGA
jgi:oligopeptide/dipeptide ABC transporter ATP-binding protein